MNCIFAGIAWQFQLLNPNPVAWVITAGYLLATWCTFSVAEKLRAASQSDRSKLAWFCYVIAAVLFAMALNSQFDLQTLWTQYCRQLVRDMGWYRRRRIVQTAFVAICALVGAASLAVGLRVMHGPCRLIYAGVIYLLTLIVIRAASLHHIDHLLYGLPVVGNWVNSGFELVGILLVLKGACWFKPQESPQSSGDPS